MTGASVLHVDKVQSSLPQVCTGGCYSEDGSCWVVGYQSLTEHWTVAKWSQWCYGCQAVAALSATAQWPKCSYWVCKWLATAHRLVASTENRFGRKQVFAATAATTLRTKWHKMVTHWSLTACVHLRPPLFNLRKLVASIGWMGDK